MEYLVIIFFSIVILWLLIQRNQSGYPSSSAATQRVASFEGYTVSSPNPWRDLDIAGYGSSYMILATGWENVSLRAINSWIWNGIPPGTTIAAPAGVTLGRSGNVWGIRKEILTNSSTGAAEGGGRLWFLVKLGEPGPRFTIEPSSAGWYIASDGVKYSIPQYVVLSKSIYDPEIPEPCQYKQVNPACNKGVADCDKFGNMTFTVNNLAPATHDGTCEAYGTPITMNSQVVTTPQQCSAPACKWATTSVVAELGGG